MRTRRIKMDGESYYHVVSRVVDRSFRMTPNEKEIFRHILRKVATFCGIEIVTYALMSNHFHLLIHIPPPREISEEELLSRVATLYDSFEANALRDQWNTWRAAGHTALIQRDQERLRKRMGDISPFVQCLKQRYSISFNARHTRKGTLWEERFHSTLVEPSTHALSTVAAYIDLNPVRAGIVPDPKDYRWSGYGESCAGITNARKGLTHIYSLSSDGATWRGTAQKYRQLLYVAASRRGNVPATLKPDGVLSMPELLRCKIRYFAAGVAIGDKKYVEKVFNAHRDIFGANRKTGARKLRYSDAWGGLCTARDLRVEPVTLPK